MLLEDQVYPPAKGGVTLAQILDRGRGNGSARDQPRRDRRLKAVVISAMQFGCLMSLDAKKNLTRVPPVRLEYLQLGSAPAQLLLPATVHLQHRRVHSHAERTRPRRQ